MIKEFNGNNRWLSNFTACLVKLDGITYPSTEAAYQAAKTIVDTERLQFQSISPGKAKWEGRRVTMRADWDSIKLSVMEDLTRQKYSTELMKFRLLNTGDVEIQEGNSWGDTFWGICGGVGQNNLGKIIMKIRQELVDAQEGEQTCQNENY
jgi:ribA/ribD-fused uncharacterized protein